MGDLNARTGGRDDRAEATDVYLARELAAMGAAGVTAADVTPSEWCAKVGPRASRDMGITNKHGTFLLDMCREQGLLILNGRLHGDEAGAHTFFQHGDTSRHCSLIDYCVATLPALV